MDFLLIDQNFFTFFILFLPCNSAYYQNARPGALWARYYWLALSSTFRASLLPFYLIDLPHFIRFPAFRVTLRMKIRDLERNVIQDIRENSSIPWGILLPGAAVDLVEEWGAMRVLGVAGDLVKKLYINKLV